MRASYRFLLTRASRARAVSPGETSCAERFTRPRPLGSIMVTSGASGLSKTAPSRIARATRLFSPSRPVTRMTQTFGRSPCTRMPDLRAPSSRPSAAISRSNFLSAIRSLPLRRKARAISRLPTLPVCSATNFRMSSREGRSATLSPSAVA